MASSFCYIISTMMITTCSFAVESEKQAATPTSSLIIAAANHLKILKISPAAAPGHEIAQNVRIGEKPVAIRYCFSHVLEQLDLLWT